MFFSPSFVVTSREDNKKMFLCSKSIGIDTQYILYWFEKSGNASKVNTCNTKHTGSWLMRHNIVKEKSKAGLGYKMHTYLPKHGRPPKLKDSSGGKI